MNVDSMTALPNTTLYEIDDVIGNRVVQRFLLAVYIVVAAVGIVGNVAVLYHLTKLRKRQRNSATRILVVNLTVCDLLNSAVCQPLRMADILQLEAGYIRVTHTYCQLSVFFGALFTITGFHILAAVSLERYTLICRPLSAKILITHRSIVQVVCFIWVLSAVCGALWSFPFVMVVDVLVQSEHMSFCMWRWKAREPLNWNVFFHLVFFIYFIAPVAIMIFSYTSIFRTLYFSSYIPANDSQRKVHQTRKSVAKVMLSVAIFFTIFHTPYFVVLLYLTYGGRIRPNPVFTLVMCKLLLLANSTVNPILYCIYSRACNGRQVLAAVSSMEDRVSKSLSTGTSRVLMRLSSAGTHRASKTDSTLEAQKADLPTK